MFVPEINKRLRIVAAILHALGALGLVAAAGSYALGIAPGFQHQRQRDTSELKRLQSLLSGASEIRHRHIELTSRLAELEQRAETMRQRIPDDPRDADFLREVSLAAEAEGLSLDDYRRGNAVDAATHSQLEIHLKTSGSYPSICGFLDRLANFPRVVKVQWMQLAASNHSQIYPLDMTLVLYFAATRDG